MLPSKSYLPSVPPAGFRFPAGLLLFSVNCSCFVPPQLLQILLHSYFIILPRFTASYMEKFYNSQQQPACYPKSVFPAACLLILLHHQLELRISLIGIEGRIIGYGHAYILGLSQIKPVHSFLPEPCSHCLLYTSRCV